MQPTPPPQQPDVHVDNVETANVTTTDHAVNDTITVRIVVTLLGLVALSIILAATILSLNDRELPPELITLGGVAVGALGAMLASTASKRT